MKTFHNSIFYVFLSILSISVGATLVWGQETVAIGPVGSDSSASPVTISVVNGINIREHSDGYVEMWGSAAGSATVSLPFTMASDDYDIHITAISGTVDRTVQISSTRNNQFISRGHGGTAVAFRWSIRGYRSP